MLAVALRDQAATDVAIRLLAVEELLEVGKAIRPDSVVREVEVLEVEIPIVELVIGVAGEKGAFDTGNVAQAVGLNVGVHGTKSVVELGPTAGADIVEEGLCRSRGWAVRSVCRSATSRRVPLPLVPGFDG